MKNLLVTCAFTVVLSACAGVVDERQSISDEIAVAFPNPSDRTGIFFASPRGNAQPVNAFRVGFYSNETTVAQVAQRFAPYCTANGYGEVAIGSVRGGRDIIQDDGPAKPSQNVLVSCG